MNWDPLGTGGPFSEKRLLLTARLNPKIQLTSNDEFRINFLEIFKSTLDNIPPKYSLGYEEENLPRDEYETNMLGDAIRRRSVLKIQLYQPPEISINSFNIFRNGMTSSIFHALRKTGLRDDVLLNPDIVLRSIVSGPFGGSRKYTTSEIVLIGEYSNTPFPVDDVMTDANTVTAGMEYIVRDGFSDIVTDSSSIDVTMDVDERSDSTRVIAFLRTDVLETDRRDYMEAVFRDIGRSNGMELNELKFVADGGTV